MPKGDTPLPDRSPVAWHDDDVTGATAPLPVTASAARDNRAFMQCRHWLLRSPARRFTREIPMALSMGWT